MLESQSRALKTRIPVTIPTKHWVQKCPIGSAPRAGKDGENNAKTPLLVTFSLEKLKLKKKKIFFLYAVQDLLNP